jgi:hypothetical protein
METLEGYLGRKHQELRLLNACLSSPLPLTSPRSVSDVIKHKFQLTAALRAEHALHDWAVTETAWTQAGQRASGPFLFRYDYQRADLEVRGPSFYEHDDGWTPEAIYTASGMAAISALLLASARVIGPADILVLPGSYGETLELIEGYARHLRLVTLTGPLEEVIGATAAPRIVLLDSCAPARAFEAVLRVRRPVVDLLALDTTCFSSGSGRIRRVLRWAGRSAIPVVMVRSHTKLDSLGAEYGRLGSAVFVHRESNDPWASRPELKELPAEMRNAIRLLGGAALPAHFPPYIGTSLYRTLTNRRVAAILRNGRRTARHFASALAGLTAELHFVHGLYVTLRSTKPLEEATARRAAAEMSDELSQAGFPIRHAGSFGFDFAATEWFHDATTDRYSVRIAIPDLPTALWDDLTEAVARWWRMRAPGFPQRERST